MILKHYPDVSYNKDTIQCAKSAGYTMAFTTEGRWFIKKGGLLALDMDYISNRYDMNIFKDMITNPNYKFTY